MSNTGVISIGVRCPIIRQGDNLVDIVIENVKKTLDENHMFLEDKDVIGITESVVARAQGNYVTIDDIVESIREVTNGKKDVVLVEPIMSRNRFAMILKAFARYADNITIIHGGEVDQQGNPTWKPNPFTGIDIDKYYEQICEQEGATYNHTTEEELNKMLFSWKGDQNRFIIDARCHPISLNVPTLASFMTYPITRKDGTKSGYNSDWGLLGSNKADEETLKLFPRKEEAQALVDSIQEYYKNAYGKDVHVLVFGDGCFCSPKTPGVEGSQIYEFADPVTCPAFSRELDGLKPNEIKIKNLADDKYRDLNGKELEEAINKEIEENKGKNLIGCMSSQGTTPRQVTDLLASLFDLCVGSGSRCCPFVLCKNYFS